MHVSAFPLDLNWFFQFLATAFIISIALLYLLKNSASNYFLLDSNFDSSQSDTMPSFSDTPHVCVVCTDSATKQCSGCKMVRYCSAACQRNHWNSGHKTKCKDLKLSGKLNSGHSRDRRALLQDSNGGISKVLIKQVLFPYEEFVELFNWGDQDSPPCGLLNCGNSCFANVVLQCLTYTRPLVAYLLEKGHRAECRRNDWCFLCEFEIHVERASRSTQAFSPINILSRLPNIGGNLGYGKQEDAHEFMRFAIDTMQSLCLDEFGGEKAVHPTAQETTLIQHIFGGHLQSQVICTKCKNVSNQIENMMDLTVEIHGDAASLEECLDQFTAREGLHGDNMYKCDGCDEYVQAWKRLTILHAPNILTIALKRFQTGRFGKLNKRVTFPEKLDISPYMSDQTVDDDDLYQLYAVVVHVDMLNASFFGHYICYTKDFSGKWYRIDDYKVIRVELDEVLSQGAYMLLYSRTRPRPTCLNPLEKEVKIVEVPPCVQQPVELAETESMDSSPATNNLDNKEESSLELNDMVLVHDNGHPGEVTVCPVLHNDDDEDDNEYMVNGNSGDAENSTVKSDSVMMTTNENHVLENSRTNPKETVTVNVKLNGKGIKKQDKPFLVPGFLAKRPRNKEIELEVGESSSSNTFELLGGQTSGCRQNGNQSGKSVDIHRTVCIESGTSSLVNGGGDSEQNNNIMITDV